MASEREVTDVIYVQEHTIAETLRVLATHFDADPNLVLIGLWNTEPIPAWSASEGRLQVVITRMVERAAAVVGVGTDPKDKKSTTKGNQQ